MANGCCGYETDGWYFSEAAPSASTPRAVVSQPCATSSSVGSLRPGFAYICPNVFKSGSLPVGRRRSVRNWKVLVSWTAAAGAFGVRSAFGMPVPMLTHWNGLSPTL